MVREVTQLVLSLFPGIGMLDMAFEEEGFCVVRGPDLLWGGDIRRFHPPAGKFDGVIGGPPCQCFSRLNFIVRAKGYKVGENLIPEFERVVFEAQPGWFVMENVPEAPLPLVDGYPIDPTVLDNRWLGEVQSRKHRFTFGSRGEKRRLHYETAALENIDRQARVCASDWKRTSPISQAALLLRKGSLNNRLAGRSLEEALKLQGLPADFFANSPLTKSGKGQMLGNGVPLAMGRAVAKAVKKAIGA